MRNTHITPNNHPTHTHKNNVDRQIEIGYTIDNSYFYSAKSNELLNDRNSFTLNLFEYNLSNHSDFNYSFYYYELGTTNNTTITIDSLCSLNIDDEILFMSEPVGRLR